MYVCRTPCFSNLAKAVKHDAALQELMTAMGATEAKCVSDGTTQTHALTDISALESHSPRHLTETSFSSSLDSKKGPEPLDTELEHGIYDRSVIMRYRSHVMFHMTFVKRRRASVFIGLPEVGICCVSTTKKSCESVQTLFSRVRVRVWGRD